MLTFTVPTTIHKRVKSGTDALGNDIWSVTDVDVDAQAFTDGSSVEVLQGQDIVITQPTVYYPPGTDVSGIDSVTVYGDTYEVDGKPAAHLQSPFTGWQPGVVVRLKEVTG